MKIKITKTVEENQIPAEVRRMLDQHKNTLMYTMPDQMSAAVRASLSTDASEFFSVIELLDAFRQRLVSLDEDLNEIQNVLSGYKDALMPPAAHKPTSNPGAGQNFHRPFKLAARRARNASPVASELALLLW